jgi:3-methyladenine DNA glycosylase AlkD
MTAAFIEKQLTDCSSPEKKAFFPYFFKTGKGQYGEGDQFLGVVVPNIRKVAKANTELPFSELEKLLDNSYHECRMCALLILVERFKKAKEEERKGIVEFYLSHTERINNWDLVDLSAKYILGEYLVGKNRDVLYCLTDSSLLWEQRIAVVATLAFIQRNDFTDILAISEKLLDHPHDLMHKAVGWMLRETGKRDKNALTGFLDRHRQAMPRTMLRYAIEKFPPEERAYYMKK